LGVARGEVAWVVSFLLVFSLELTTLFPFRQCFFL
jgi:hypothetical protein